MGGWLVLVFQFISAIPAIIKTIREIADLIKNMRSKDDQQKAKEDLAGIWQATKGNDDAAKSRLSELRDELKKKLTR